MNFTSSATWPARSAAARWSPPAATALFGVLAVIAILAALAVAVLVPRLQPAPRARTSVPGLAGQLTSATFLRPVLLLAAATAALSAGVGFLPVLAGLRHLGPLAAGAWYPSSPRPPPCSSPSPADGSTTAALARAWPPPRWPRARPGSSSP